MVHIEKGKPTTYQMLFLKKTQGKKTKKYKNQKNIKKMKIILFRNFHQMIFKNKPTKLEGT